MLEVGRNGYHIAAIDGLVQYALLLLLDYYYHYQSTPILLALLYKKKYIVHLHYPHQHVCFFFLPHLTPLRAMTGYRRFGLGGGMWDHGNLGRAWLTDCKKLSLFSCLGWGRDGPIGWPKVYYSLTLSLSSVNNCMININTRKTGHYELIDSIL